MTANTFTVTVSTEALLARLKNIPVKMRRALVTAVTRLSVETQRKVMVEKLSGQVLHVRTGTLRRSINREVTEEADGVFAIVGTNVRYAAIHEYGGTILLKPRERTVHFKMNKDGTLKQGFSKKKEATVSIKTAARSVGTYVNMPERSFLRSTMTEMAPRIRTEIKRAALGVLK